MKRSTFAPIAFALAAVLAYAPAAPAWGKLPPPGDEAKAKAAEAAAKTAWSDKVGAYQTCQAQMRVAARYFADAKQAGRDAPPALETPACVDPGRFAAASPAKP